MAPRRGDVAEERRDGESIELGGKITEMEGKIDALDGKVASLEERLTALDAKFEKCFSSLEVLIRSSWGTQAQASNEKGKGPLPNPNSEVYQEDQGEEDPPMHATDSLLVPQGEGEGVGQGNRGGRLHVRNPRQGRLWARGGGWGVGREVGGHGKACRQPIGARRGLGRKVTTLGRGGRGREMAGAVTVKVEGLQGR